MQFRIWIAKEGAFVREKHPKKTNDIHFPEKPPSGRFFCCFIIFKLSAPQTTHYRAAATEKYPAPIAFIFILFGVFRSLRCVTKGFASGHHELFEKSSIKNFFASTSECANASDRRVLKPQFRTKPKREIGCMLSLLIAEHNMAILKVVDDSQ
ncbi:hypothetical protein [Negativibacillus massiliensis]|uniref:hypothetical protein n=1 Tax=Negativibacillus massiliensis TaxID=1871035 RepID=UPI003AF2C102